MKTIIHVNQQTEHYVNNDRINEILDRWSVTSECGHIVFDSYDDLVSCIEKLTGLVVVGVED